MKATERENNNRPAKNVVSMRNTISYYKYKVLNHAVSLHEQKETMYTCTNEGLGFLQISHLSCNPLMLFSRSLNHADSFSGKAEYCKTQGGDRKSPVCLLSLQLFGSSPFGFLPYLDFLLPMLHSSKLQNPAAMYYTLLQLLHLLSHKS